MDAPIIVGVSAPRRAENDGRGHRSKAIETVARGRDMERELEAMHHAIANAAREIDRMARELATAQEVARKFRDRPAWKWLVAWCLGEQR